MDFYNKFFSKADENKRKEFITRLQQSAVALEKEILKLGTINEDSDHIQLFIETFIEVIEDGLNNPNKARETSNRSYLWNLISSTLIINSIKSINASTQPGNEARKLSLWVLIELDNKTLASSFEKMARDPDILEHYIDNSIVKKSSGEVKQILERLMRSEFTLQSDTIKTHHKAHSDSDLKRIPEGNSPTKSENSPQAQSNQTPKNIDEIKGNLDRYRKLLQKTQNNVQQQEKQSFIRDDYQKYLEQKQEKKPLHVLRKILVPDKLLALNPIRSKPKLRKTSSFDDLDAKKLGLDDNKFHGNEEHSATHPTQKHNMSMSGHKESVSNADSSITEETNQSIRSDPKVMFTADDYGMFGDNLYGTSMSHKPSAFRSYSIHKGVDLGITKRSEVLFREKYKAIQEGCEYRDPPTKVVKPEDQGYKCFSCQAQLSKILLMVWKKNAFCHYTGYWYCSDCMSEEKLYIPWYIESSFDFKRYHVCKKARDELHSFYAKPNMFIDSKSPVVQKNKIFYETLVLKRELHLIFDMICEGLFLLDLLGQNSNLLLKMNLLSVKNLVDIESGAMKQYIEKSLKLMINHMEGCKFCQSKGKICPACSDKKKIFAYDIRNTSICKACKSLYHTKCLYRRECIVCQHNS